MARLMLNDELWSKLRGIMRQHRIYDKPNLRMMVEAMLYRMRVGCPWRDLPADFGCWNSIYQQINRWSLKDKLIKIFKVLVQDPDLDGSSLMAVLCELTNTVLVLLVRLLGNLLVATRQKFIWQLMPADCRLNLILLAERFMTVKPTQILLKSYLCRNILLRTRVMTVRIFANKFVKKHPYPSYLERKIPKLETAT